VSFVQTLTLFISYICEALPAGHVVKGHKGQVAVISATSRVPMCALTKLGAAGRPKVSIFHVDAFAMNKNTDSVSILTDNITTKAGFLPTDVTSVTQSDRIRAGSCVGRVSAHG
jgi:hypothetical protein